MWHFAGTMVPPKLRTLLDLIHDQLFFTKKRLVSITQTECHELGLSTADIHQIMDYLQELGLIAPYRHYDDFKEGGKPTSDEDKEYVMKNGFNATGGSMDANLLHFVLVIPVTEKFDAFYKQATQTTGAQVHYNPTTGSGWANGKEFKFKDHKPEFRVFAQLVERIGNSVPRAEILALMGHEENKTATDDLTRLVVKMRERTGLDKKQLVQNNGNITLVGTLLDNPPL